MKTKLPLFFLFVFFLIISLNQSALGDESRTPLKASNFITFFMTGDVMAGRGIDQVLPHPGDPRIFEPYMKDARGYVELAEKANGRIKKPVSCTYIWGDTLTELERKKPDVRIINLETAVTKSNDKWKGKGIHYRMNPGNISCIKTAGIDIAVLANNHILDWGYPGLTETKETLEKAGIKSAGAGQSLQEARKPAVIEVKGKGKVIVYSFGSVTSGIPFSWAATEKRPGVSLLNGYSDKTVRYIQQKIRKTKKTGDVVAVSIHWGENWGYDINPAQKEFAHKLIDDAGVDIVHGHSSHHIKGIEVYKGKLILYGSGDFLNDYEGIAGYESFRDDLGLMYFVSVDSLTGELIHLHMTPTRIQNLRVNRATKDDVLWLRDVLNREGKEFGTHVVLTEDSTLALQWK
jgi:poly-gamma-glutamate synthesis protein (capsule biosynthesis protein)